VAKKSAETAKTTAKSAGKLSITQVRSQIGTPDAHRKTMRALGFSLKHQQTKVHHDTPAIRGMLNQVSYLVTVQEVKE
jgi:large subunit ribosomal protein L30